MRYLTVNTAKRISKIGLGTSQFGSDEWGYGASYDSSEARAIVRRAVELGVTLFDTAEIYGSGRSERILGAALDGDLDSVVIATKLFPVLPGSAVVKHRAAASAKRLRASRLDLYQVHWPNPFLGDTSIMGGMRRLQESAKVGEVGVSGYSVQRWQAAERALGSRVLSNQVGYSLAERCPELDLLPFAESTGHVIIAFSPLAKGLLSGRYHRDSLPAAARAKDRHFHPDYLDRTDELISTLREVGDAHCATPAQIALAWVVRRPAVVAIVGAANVEQVEDNIAAAEIHLADDEYRALNDASARLQLSTAMDAYPRRGLTAIRHLAKGGKYLTRTIVSDYRAHSGVEQLVG